VVEVDTRNDDEVTLGSVLIAITMALVIVTTALLFVPLRDRIDNANVALVLMALVVIGAARGGRLTGLLSAVVASLSFNFLHTKPYESFTIHATDDLVMFGLLLIGGLVVGELAARRSSELWVSRRRLEALGRLRHLVRLVALDRPVLLVWAEARAEIIRSLGALDAWFEPADAITAGAVLPVLEAGGITGARVHRWLGAGFSLPIEGVQLRVHGDHGFVGRVVVRPDPSRAVSDEDRRNASAAVALLSISLGRHPTEATRLTPTGLRAPRAI
jgi:hypothetical protein